MPIFVQLMMGMENFLKSKNMEVFNAIVGNFRILLDSMKHSLYSGMLQQQYSIFSDRNRVSDIVENSDAGGDGRTGGKLSYDVGRWKEHKRGDLIMPPVGFGTWQLEGRL